MTLEVHYFPVRARGEAIRLLLHFKGVKFEDVRYTFEEWGAKKSSFKFGQIPVLEVEGQQIAHSWCILRYLAKKYHLAGKDEHEAVHLDQVLELYRDFNEAWGQYIRVIAGFVQGDKEQIRRDNVLPALAKFGPYFERFLKEAGSGFFGKSGVSYVDFYIAEGILTLYKQDSEFLEANYPYFVQHMKKVHGLPELQHYLNSSERPNTQI